MVEVGALLRVIWDLSVDVTTHELYIVIAVGLLINKKAGNILDGDCLLVTKTGEAFYRRLVICRNINNIDEMTTLFVK